MSLKELVPAVKADDEEPEEEEQELVDPQETLREKCNEDKHIEEMRQKYDECNDRVNSRSNTTETCTEELFDYLHALDHCVSKTLFSYLK